MTPAIYAACDWAFHVIRPDGTILRAGRASLYVLERLGWGWVARLLALPPFVWAVEVGYRIVAANRGFFSRFLFRGE
jgi:predicted DCC family thiol-disulfide oxidoreductase YuxK